MRSIIRWFKRHPVLALLWSIAIVSLAFGAYAQIARATDKPTFCTNACHEMTPYYSAWTGGGHSGVSCVECHVGSSAGAKLAHKFVALKEVYAHFTTSPKFPLAEPTVVPDSRCIRCHPQVIVRTANFSHAEHAARGTCISCHPGVGHQVNSQALQQAGIFNTSSAAAQSAPGAAVAIVDRGAANLPGHVSVSCSRCHDLAKTGCSACHTPRHKTGGAKRTASCETCHRPGTTFVFAHPSSAQCESCHARPAKHRAGDCTSCHASPGVSWAFKHPAAPANCESCHARPSGHRAGACTTCHSVGSSWLFKHPSLSANCESCHARPAGHRSGACSTCHSPGSWRFRHSGARNCSSCHRAPANHFGANCASCHSPSRSWRSASFAHPRVPGGEHSYHSFSCVSCHPSGYSSYSCTRCHDSKTGPRDD